MKVCITCKESRALELFYRNRTKKDGLQSICKACSKAGYVNNRDHLTAYAKNYREDNKDEVEATKRAWVVLNKDKVASSQKAWYETNKEEVRATQKEYYKANRERCIESSKGWQKANPDKRAEHTRAYNLRNPGKVNARAAKRRAAKLLRTPNWVCYDTITEYYICAKKLQELTGIEFHIDHIVPLQGELVSGLHVAANLQILTAHDNVSKSNSFEVC